MKISEIITDKYKLRIPPTVYYELLADVQEAEEEQEPKTGHWIALNDDYLDWYECSECGYGSEGEIQYSSEYDVRTNYCPCCGAKMEEVEE